MTQLRKYLLPAGTIIFVNIVDYNWIKVKTTDIAVLTVRDINGLTIKEYLAADDQLYDDYIKKVNTQYHFILQKYKVGIKPSQLQILE